MNELDNLASISCDIMSSRSKDGFPIHQPIVIGNSIVCDGYVSGKTTAVFTHFHDDHTWNFRRTLANCHHILLTEPTYLALQTTQGIPERGNIERLPYNRPFPTAAGEIIELINANHIPGSCQILVTMKESNKKILYSGDFSFPDMPTPKADVLVLDGTHGIPTYNFNTDKPSILRRIFDEVCTQIDDDHPVEILANRGTMQDIMAQLEKTVDGNSIEDDVPFLAEKTDVDLTNAIKYTYNEDFRDIEISSNNRLNELYGEKKPYVRFARPGSGSMQQERATVIQADVNPGFKENGAFWTDKNGKIYACLAAHSDYDNILKYVELVGPQRVIVDGTRTNSDTARSLANTISKKFGITAFMSNYRP